MTLRDLCFYFKKFSQDELKCEVYKNQYFVANHNNFHYEELDESDILGLRPYLQCFVLSVYEWLSECFKCELPDWVPSIYCTREENDYYNELKRGYLNFHDNLMGLDEWFDSMLSRSLPVFRKRGIVRYEFDDSV